jgi:hypothetical protein
MLTSTAGSSTAAAIRSHPCERRYSIALTYYHAPTDLLLLGATVLHSR